MFREGSHQMKPIDFGAGETKSFILEFDWSRDCVTPDWSLTAWAERGALTVKHTDGIPTQRLPYIERTGELQTEPTTVLSVGSVAAPEKSVEVDELQEELNRFVLDFDIDVPSGYCGFRWLEEMNDELQRYETVAAHNCRNYGVNLTIYIRPQDWDGIERQFRVVDELTGEVVQENDLVGCQEVSPIYSICMFHLAPDNPRMGLLKSPGSLQMLTYSARWAPVTK